MTRKEIINAMKFFKEEAEAFSKYSQWPSNKKNANNYLDIFNRLETGEILLD